MGEVETVFNLERLTHRSLLGTRAHCTWRHATCLAYVYGLVAHVARDTFLPQIEVDGGQCAAGNTWVEERVGNVEQRSLDVGHGVAVVAHRLGQGHLPDLVQLRLGEPDQWVSSLVPEPVTLPQVPELNANDAGKCWSNQSSVKRGF